MRYREERARTAGHAESDCQSTNGTLRNGAA